MFSAAVILCTAFTCMTASEPEDVQEDDSIAVTALVIIAAAATAGVIGYFLGKQSVSSDADVRPYLRLVAADNMSDVTAVATTFTANANANYAQLWGMTKEHWVRQAELEAYAKWEKDSVYQSDRILEGSRAYENNSVMTANAVAQINSFFLQVSDRVDEWDDDTYNGKMKAGFVFDSDSFYSTSNDFGCGLVSVAGTGNVYIGKITGDYIVTVDKEHEGTEYKPGYIFNPGSPTVITGKNTYSIPTGITYLDTLTSTSGKAFEPGVYRISGTLCGDTFSEVIENHVSLKPGIVMHADGQDRLAILENDKISLNGQQSSAISFKVVPSDIPSDTSAPERIDLTSVLKTYNTLLKRLYWTTVSANNSAAAVWNIYDKASEKNYGVSTLMSENVYDSVVLSEGMNEVMTLSAMKQLAEYYDTYDGKLDDLQIGLYGNGMDAPFVRGSVYDQFGNPLYSDVIFTPFFQSDDVTLERSSDYEVDQNCILAVWSEGKELNSWYESGMKADGYQTMVAEKGYRFSIRELGTCDDSGMHNQSSIEFKVSKVNYIEPGKAKMSDTITVDDITDNWLKIACIVIGAILILLGAYLRNPTFIIIGIGVVLFGFFLADPVVKWFSSLRVIP